MPRFRDVWIDVALGVVLCSAVAYAVSVRIPRQRKLSSRDWARVQTGGTPLSGAPARAGGPVLVEFLDYQCPYCAAAESEVFATLRDSLPRLRREVRHYPLPYHRSAFAAALAAECARAQTGTMEPMHRLLYAKQDSLGVIAWTALASRIPGADTARFAVCMRDSSVAARVEADVRLGKEVGVNATPTFFLDGRAVPPLDEPRLRAYLLAHADAGRPK